MRLRQIRIDNQQEQDRLLLRISTNEGSELRFWLTRRFVKGMSGQELNCSGRDR
jgi:hypothetical protein